MADAFKCMQWILWLLLLITQILSENHLFKALDKTQIVNRPHDADNILAETAKRLKDELTADYWTKKGQTTVEEHVASSKQWNNHGKRITVAKNGILVVGGGMSLTTIKGARVVKGLPGKEEAKLAFENFPVLGLAKPYCIDSQVGDDGCTASAYLGGAKSFRGTIGTSEAGSIAQWALDAGKDIGIITTSSLTHPSIGGVYAKLNNPVWEGGNDIMQDEENLAYQLLNNDPGKQFKVILGGGRSQFLPNGHGEGNRSGKRNLIEEWIEGRLTMSARYEYVTTNKQLELIGNETDHLLGLFAPGPLDYHLLANGDSQPTLEEMTKAAIKILSKNKNGYFLFVYGGRISDAHKENRAKLAIDETLQLSKAVEKIISMTSSAGKHDTLVVVTANYANTMTLSGYSSRWNNIFDKVDFWDNLVYDNTAYLTISYANGPGYKKVDALGARRDETKDPLFGDPRYRYPATFPLKESTSGGEDVAVFAEGPFARLFTGNYEQHLIPHMMAYAMCVGHGDTACGHKETKSVSYAVTPIPFSIAVGSMVLVVTLFEKCFI